MKQEFLKNLGLDEDIIAKIQAENGKDINAEKDKLTVANASLATLQGEVDVYKTKIAKMETANGDSEKIKTELESLKEKLAEKQAEETKATAEKQLNDNILTAIGEKKFTSDYVKNGLIADIKASLADTQNAGKGITEIFESLTKDKIGIFENPNHPADMQGMNEIETPEGTAQMRTIMGLKEV